MRLILVRHAEAGNVGQGGVRTDFDRALTARGHGTANALAERLKMMGVRVDVVVSSPLVRARQTAEPLLGLVDSARSVLVTCDDLAPDAFKPKKVARAVEELGVRSAAVVGHLPDIAHFAGWLVGSGGRGVAFDKGTAGLIDTGGAVGEGTGTLVWLVTPEWYE
jgi:phosphohistidine phosphatase